MIGACIGFFSGLIGIGGGIILSPIILLLGWGDAKEAAASSALFIWVNSIAGLMGQWNNGVIISSNVWIMIFANALWLWAGYLWKEPSVVGLNLAMVLIYVAGAIKLFI